MILLSLAFRPKNYLKPESEEELSRCLKEFGANARIIAGGTGLYEIAHRGLLSEVEALIDISRLKLSYVKEDQGSISIGSATTMSALGKSEFISRKEFAAVADALKVIQPLQVKNVATIGGAICTALPFLDLPVALLALNAKVKISPGDKVKPLSDFIKGYFSVDLSESEYLKEIELSSENSSSGFQKFALTHDDWAMMNCAVSVTLNGERIKSIRIFFGGGLGEKPTRASTTEKELADIRSNDEERIKEILEKNLHSDIEPISDIRSSADFRMHIAKVLGRRTLAQAVERFAKSAVSN